MPLDGSPEAEGALPHALALAERFEAVVTLVRAVIPAALGTGRGPGPYPRALVADERLEAAVYLADIARRFRRHGVRVRTEPVEAPATEVLARFRPTRWCGRPPRSADGWSISVWAASHLVGCGVRPVRSFSCPEPLALGARRDASRPWPNAEHRLTVASSARHL